MTMNFLIKVLPKKDKFIRTASQSSEKILDLVKCFIYIYTYTYIKQVHLSNRKVVFGLNAK